MAQSSGLLLTAAREKGHHGSLQYEGVKENTDLDLGDLGEGLMNWGSAIA